MQDVSDDAVLKRLHDFNCEWLQWPNIAILEIAQTLRGNFSLLRQQSSDVLNAEFVEDLLLPFEPLSDALSRLDNKDEYQ